MQATNQADFRNNRCIIFVVVAWLKLVPHIRTSSRTRKMRRGFSCIAKNVACAHLAMSFAALQTVFHTSFILIINESISIFVLELFCSCFPILFLILNLIASSLLLLVPFCLLLVAPYPFALAPTMECVSLLLPCLFTHPH